MEKKKMGRKLLNYIMENVYKDNSICYKLQEESKEKKQEQAIKQNSSYDFSNWRCGQCTKVNEGIRVEASERASE